MTIGIYGGSFNPIHRGHTQLADYLCKHRLVDELWFMVSPCNPLKADSSDILDEQARLHLAQIATAEQSHLKVSDFEFHLPRPSYTVDTLRALRTTYPKHEFVLIIGADNWLVFDRWKAPEEILQYHRIVIYPRPGYEIDKNTLPQGVTLVNTPLFPISSTEIRQRISKGLDVSDFVDPAVEKEIYRQGYYRK